jgi:hypothetical protein
MSESILLWVCRRMLIGLLMVAKPLISFAQRCCASIVNICQAYYPGHGKNTWIHKKITALTFTTGELDELIKNYRNRN